MSVLDCLGDYLYHYGRPVSYVLAIAAILVLLLCGCSWSSSTRERIVETNDIEGSVAGAPVAVKHRRVVDRQEESEGTKDTGLESVMQAAGTLAGSSPWGALIGLVTTAGAGYLAIRKDKQAKTAQRQRDELIDGVESAKDHMDPTTWGKVRKTLTDNQSDDTIDAVRERTA